MKTNKVLGVFVIIAFVLLGLVYAQFMQQEQLTGKNVQVLSQKVDGFDGVLKKIESSAKSSMESVKNMEAKVTAGDSERKDLSAKIDNMSKDIQQLQNDVKTALAAKEVKVSAAPTPEPAQPAPVAPVAPEAQVSTTPAPAPEQAPVTATQ